MVLKSPSATTSMFFSIARCQGRDFQDHGAEWVPDHGFARVGTMQVQAIMPPAIQGSYAEQRHFLCEQGKKRSARLLSETPQKRDARL